ncbi:hypothetical protein TSAR_000282 [Trichomalopsis sarcophagae]|uniref:Uncharacterized protein n=1 Tax=Trichomalopsis sarcophagae TaxID=543379 RepID=A0A232EP87_9HYME|nr:hypothetical protein TSAR_000282 [Trichomalopsis sarcophagae]
MEKIQRIVRKYSHLFYQLRDPAPRTSCVRHKIRITEPVRVKYKRGPTGQDEVIQPTAKTLGRQCHPTSILQSQGFI